MDIYDKLEKAGHNIVMITPILAGVTTYYCDRCGALIQLQDGNIRLFHVPPTSNSKQDACLLGLNPNPSQLFRADTLQEKLDRLYKSDWTKL